ncbi:MAG: hypothetical protein WDA27_13800 [Actinomycetota bacterium]
MAPRDAFGVFARSLGLWLSVTSALALFNVLWDQSGHLEAGWVIRLSASVVIGLILLVCGDGLARRLYSRSASS